MTRTGRGRTAISAAALACTAFALAPAGASAQTTTFNCDASAIRAALLTLPPIEPVTANSGQAQCQNATGTLAQFPGGLPLPLSAQVAQAQTSVTGDAQTATAVGGLGTLGVTLNGIPQLQAAVSGAVQQAQAGAQPQINSIPPIALPGGLGAVDVRAALTALLNGIGATNADLADLQLATATATARCVSGAPVLSGDAQVAGLKVLGQTIPTDAASTQAINLINTQSINPANIDPSQVTVNGVTPPTALYAAIKQALARIPPIDIPAQVASIQVTPKEQITANGQLTERALHVQVSLAGQSVADVVAGEARVSNQSVACGASAASRLALQCTTRRLTLIDVLTRGNHVALLGAADRRLVGKRVAIIFRASHKRVATAVVKPNGFFTARAPLPPRRIRFGNSARYQARAGKERSLSLKLHRRMVVTSLRSSGSVVVLKGRVIRPLAKPIAPIYVQRRVSCTRLVNVKRIRPRRDGSFTVRVAAPPNTQAAVYRAATKVRKTASNPKRFPTFTLPREVQIG